VRIALGTLASWGRLKNPGLGAGREVARNVTCRWIYGCFLIVSLLLTQPVYAMRVNLRDLFLEVR
jgi:hypothetical protein